MSSNNGRTCVRALNRAGATAGALLLLVCLAAGAVSLLAVVMGYRVSPVLTGSMSPAYRPGDAIVTRTVAVSSLRPGMIPVVVPPGYSAPFAHRIVTITGNADSPVLTTRGDANPATDAWHARVEGARVPVVVGTIPRIGSLLLWLRGERLASWLLCLVGIAVTVLGLRISIRPHQPAVANPA